MRDLRQKTTRLFRQQPALCLLMLGAALLSIIADSLLTATPTKSLHSVPRPSFNALMVKALVGSVFGICAGYLRVLAFFVTALAAVAIQRNPNVSLRKALRLVRLKPWEIFWFAAKLMVAEVGLLFLLQAVTTTYFRHSIRDHTVPLHPPFSMSVLVSVIGLTYAVFMAYLFTPSALTLLRPPDAPYMESHSLRQARTFAMQCAAASFAISVPFQIPYRYMVPHSLALSLVSGLCTLLRTLPYIPLAIFFGDLAQDVAWPGAQESPTPVPPTYNVD